MAQPLDLAALNSATKYPSIPTHHELDPKSGALLESATAFTDDAVVTEKVDGTNGRLVLLEGGDYVIGSREELLHAKGDRISNPAQGIVAALKPLAERLSANASTGSGITVLYLEVYGNKIGAAAKQYQSGGAVGHRLFDRAVVDTEVLGWDLARISAWREDGGQQWTGEQHLLDFAAAQGVALTPRLGTVSAADLPAGVEDMHEWLKTVLPSTLVALDEGAQGGPEGIVLRTADRAVISKARFQDYARTLKRRAPVKR